MHGGCHPGRWTSQNLIKLLTNVAKISIFGNSISQENGK
jgi:hypothetical protein